MNEPTSNNSKQKWIVLSVLFLFILSGGIYQLNKPKSSSPNSSSSAAAPSSAEVATRQADQHSTESVIVGGAAVAPSNSGASSDSGAAPGKIESSTSPQSHVAAPQGGIVPSVALAAPATGIAGFFKSIFGGSKPGSKDGNGTPEAKLAEIPSLQSTEQVAVPKPVDTCVTVAFRHKALPGHSDEEACSSHKNHIKLPHENIKQDSLCVRVNGTPVHYVSVKGHSDEIVIGAIAGPKAKVTVKYCVGKATCAQVEDCSIPKDEFMEAIGGNEGNESKNARLGQWDPAHPSEKEADVLAKLDGDVKRELATNDDLNGRSNKGEIFKDWISEDPTPACGIRQAKN